jgi:hypothetical protein
VVPRRALTFLVYALPLLVVAFGVSMGGFAVAHVTADTAGADVLWRVAMACLMLLVANAVLLLGALGINAVTRCDPRWERPAENGEQHRGRESREHSEDG